MGLRRSPWHCLRVLSRSGRPLAPGSAAGLQGRGRGGSAGRRPVPLPADAEKSLPSAQRGQDLEGPEPRSARRGGKARAPLRGGPGSFRLLPSLVSHSRRRTPHRLPAGEAQGPGGGSRGACPPVPRFLGSHLLVAPEPGWLSARPFPGLVSPFLLRPSPSSLLPGPSPPSSPSQHSPPESVSGLRTVP